MYPRRGGGASPDDSAVTTSERASPAARPFSKGWTTLHGELKEESLESMERRTPQSGLKKSASGPKRPGISSAVYSARSVEFIARPGETDNLRTIINEVVRPMLAEQEGFLGIVILMSQREPRLVSAVSFWKTDLDSSTQAWEDVPLVRNLLEPLSDRSPRAQIFEVYLPVAMELQDELTGLPVC